MKSKEKYIDLGYEKVKVPRDVYDAYSRWIWNTFRREKRYGRCTAVSWGICEGDCYLCSYRCASEFIPLEAIENQVYALGMDVEEIVLAKIYLEEILQMAEKIDPEGRTIIQFKLSGLKDEEAAKWFGVQQPAYTQRKNKLLAKLRKKSEEMGL